MVADCLNRSWEEGHGFITLISRRVRLVFRYVPMPFIRVSLEVFLSGEGGVNKPASHTPQL